MKTKSTAIRILTILFLCATPLFGQIRGKQKIDPAVAKLGKGFTSNTAQVNADEQPEKLAELIERYAAVK